jgi:hypothetical protein
MREIIASHWNLVYPTFVGYLQKSYPRGSRK